MLRIKVKFTDGTKVHLTVKPWCTVKDVKDKLCAEENIPTACQRIFFRGAELANTWPLTLAEDRAALFCVVSSSRSRRGASGSQDGRASLEIRGTSSDCAPVLRQAIRDAQRGLQLNLKPILADDGSGGTYFLRGARKQYVAVFKPRDEEPGAINNPRGYVGEHGQIAANRGIFAGQACDRELAAYLLDHAGMAGVPPTALSEAVHPTFHHEDQSSTSHVKVGILQQFVASDDVAGNLASSMFSVSDVQRIALFDMRLLNTDRNDSNILVRRVEDVYEYDEVSRSPPTRSMNRSRFTLIPIDHGYCLPQTLNIGWCDWCWLSWKQISEPLSPALVDYVASLDADKDAFRLQRETSISKLALKNMRIAVMLLKIGVAAGLTLSEIASLMIRNDTDLEKPSELEVAVLRATALAESLVRSPRMRGNSLTSSPTSPSRKSPSPSRETKKDSIPNSPMASQSLGLPAISAQNEIASSSSQHSHGEEVDPGNARFDLNRPAAKKAPEPTGTAKEVYAAGTGYSSNFSNSVKPIGVFRKSGDTLKERLSFDSDQDQLRRATGKSGEKSSSIMNGDFKNSSPISSSKFEVKFEKFDPSLPSVMSVMKDMAKPVETKAKVTANNTQSLEELAAGITKKEKIGFTNHGEMKDAVLLPPSSPERKSQRRERRRKSSSSTTYHRPSSFTDADDNDEPSCVCSDDERFLRSPTRRLSKLRQTETPITIEGKSLIGTSSPENDLSSPDMANLGGGQECAVSLQSSIVSSSSPKGISRTMSFLDIRNSSSFTEDNPRRILRSATTTTDGDALDENRAKSTSTHKRTGSVMSTLSLNSSDAVTKLDRAFFSYLKKLFVDLVELKFRARRRKSAQNNGGNPSRLSGRQASIFSDSCSTSSDDDSDGENRGSFFVGAKD